MFSNEKFKKCIDILNFRNVKGTKCLCIKEYNIVASTVQNKIDDMLCYLDSCLLNKRFSSLASFLNCPLLLLFITDNLHGIHL